MEDTGQEKVQKYEHFLNETLKRDLKKALDARDAVYSEIAEYLQLRSTIEAIKESKDEGEELKTKVDLGCNFYMQAKVPDSSMICVSIGYGFFLNMKLDEAVKFINKKVAHLTERSEVLTRDVNNIKAHIKVMIEGLRELQNIEDRPPDQGYRDVLA